MILTDQKNDPYRSKSDLFLKMIQTPKIDPIFKNIIQSQVLITPFFSHEYGYE